MYNFHNSYLVFFCKFCNLGMSIFYMFCIFLYCIYFVYYPHSQHFTSKAFKERMVPSRWVSSSSHAPPKGGFSQLSADGCQAQLLALCANTNRVIQHSGPLHGTCNLSPKEHKPKE